MNINAIKNIGRLLIPSLLLSLFWGCSTEVDLNAPEKEIWVVYSVLNESDSVQYVRVTKGFLPEGNALIYAKENDISAKGLKVTLTGGGKTYQATEISDVPKEPQDGVFFPSATIYKIETAGANALVGGERYDLEITQPDNSAFFLRSYTHIPEKVNFFSPITSPAPILGQRCLRQMFLDAEVKIEFSKSTAVGFEVRAFLDYKENGESKTADYGPTQMFTTSNRCPDPSSNALCYKFREKEILSAFLIDINPQFGNTYTYFLNDQTSCDFPADLPDDFRIEVTAIDTFLTNYQLANDPKFVDLNTVRPEYTNIVGTGEVLGLFGSYSTNIARARLNPCTEYLLGIREQKPTGVCEL